ncbi:hypothetical protein MNBD_BACTEROID01-2230 [hydrothermal vent metagenome]|uniref:Macroglobulin domain-containing protein n=1 Tax=hydrothermal vent metagenome TaxID=652676 RepID=A0A3B0USD9_9ZZZZ
MKRKILISALISTIALFNNLYGQKPEEKPGRNFPAEKLTVHITQECAFPGEVVWFKIYCTSPLYPEVELSRMAYIELVNSDNASLLRKKILLEGGEGEGAFIIPGNIQTGVYYIMSYTNWMKNFGEESFFKTSITIINPNEKFDYLEGERGDTEVVNSGGSCHKKIVQELKVTPLKGRYATREKVTVKIETGGIPGQVPCGNFSVSVYRKEPSLHIGGKFHTSEHALEQPESLAYLPDYNGVRLTGNITGASGKPIAGGQVVLSFPGQGTDVNSTKTDKNGDFHFLLKPNEGEKDVVFTLPRPNLKLKLEESFWNGFRKPPTKAVLMLGEDAAFYLKERYAHFQLQGKFKQKYFKVDKQSEGVNNGNWLFYAKPHKVIEIGEYITLDSITEYFWELIPSVKFVQRKGEYDISVINPLTFLPFEDAPGVFIDGVLYSDYDEIANIPVEEARQIAVIADTYYYRDFTFGGIVDIHTKKGDFSSVGILPCMVRVMYPLGAPPEVRYTAPDYSKIEPQTRIPDLRYLICWKPDVKLNDKGEATVEFYTSDVEGEFIVKVVALSNDGEILHCKNEILVKTL